MVEVFKIGEKKPTKHLGEIVFNENGYFRLHSSDKMFDEKEYCYKTII